MDFNEAVDYIHSHSRQLLSGYLESDKSGKGFICPACGNGGTGGSGDGIREDPHNKGRYKCFKCNFYGDVFDIVGLKEGISDKREIFKTGSDLFGLDLEFKQAQIDESALQNRKLLLTGLRKQALSSESGPFDEKITAAGKELESDIEALNFLKSREISLDTARKAGVGVVSFFKGIKKGILFPSSGFGFNVRNIDLDCPKKDRFRKVSDGIDLPFNILKIKKQSLEPLYVAEGEMDALSILEAGIDAVSLNGQGREALLFSLKELNINRPLVLALDADERGREGSALLKDLLEKNSFAVYESRILKDGSKDPNESLCRDKEHFIKALREESGRLGSIQKKSRFFDSSVLHGLDELSKSVKNQTGTRPVKTGFPQLESPDLLDGGLYEGVYLIGGISSTGKSTFVHQMADQIAKNGQRVLLFSLEMNRKVMIAKSLSRESYLSGLSTPMTMREVLNMENKKPTAEEIGVFEALLADYRSQIEDRINIIDNFELLDIEAVEGLIKEYYEEFGSYPVLIIDYLQMLRPNTSLKSFPSEKQIIDNTMLAIKRVSRLGMPVIVVSSFNRESYRSAESRVGMHSYLGSSLIEYTADVLMVLEADQGREETESRFVNLRILKNRNGCAGSCVRYEYVPKYNCFKEIISESKEGLRLGLRKKWT